MGHKYVKEDETFNTSQNGVVPKPTVQEVTDNKFLRADGAWASGAGGSVVSADQVVTSGIEIGGITIDGARTALYAPQHTYSTSEHVVGKWINSKPLYEKTVYVSNLPSSSGSSAYNTGIVNGEIAWIFDGYAANGSGQFAPLNWARPESTISDQIGCNLEEYGAKIRIRVGTNRSSWSAYVTIRYTKTTDSV